MMLEKTLLNFKQAADVEWGDPRSKDNPDGYPGERPWFLLHILFFVFFRCVSLKCTLHESNEYVKSNVSKL